MDTTGSIKHEVDYSFFSLFLKSLRQDLVRDAVQLARLEGLEAHARAAEKRLNMATLPATPAIAPPEPPIEPHAELF